MSNETVTVKKWLGDLKAIEDAAQMYVNAVEEGWSKVRRDYWYDQLRRALNTFDEDGAWSGFAS